MQQFDSNSEALYNIVKNLNSLELISKGLGIPVKKSPWTPDSSARPLKPDFIFRYQSIIVVLEGDKDDGVLCSIVKPYFVVHNSPGDNR